MSAVMEAREPSAKYLNALQPPLVRHFDLMATAPGGVAKLRELIFRLAAMGRLIQSRETLQSARLDEVAEFVMGQAPPGADCNMTGQGTIFVKTGEFGALYPEVREWTTRPLKFAKQGDVLICVVGATVGKLNLAIDCAIGRSVAAIRPKQVVDTKYLYYSLVPFTLDLRRQSRGSAQGVIGKTELGNVTVRVPPLAEQSSIVTRVEELMRLCDALEAQGQLEAAQHAQLVQTLLGALTASTSPEELADNWQRVATHFDLLLDRPEAIDALEQTILQLAVRGLLVPQDPNDEPASKLLKKIRADKDRLIAEGKIKRDKQLAPNMEEEAPFALPLGWERVTIDTLASVGSGTTPSRDNSEFFSDGSISWVTSGETGKPFIAETAQHVTEAALAQTSLTVYPVGTLIVAMYGQGKTRGQVSELQIEATTNQACAAIVLVEPSPTHRSFVKLVFEKSYEEMRELSAGGAQPNLNVGKIKSTLIPLPPLAEQSRIVARVESLRRLCADLRQRLAARQTTQAHLAEALIAEVA